MPKSAQLSLCQVKVICCIEGNQVSSRPLRLDLGDHTAGFNVAISGQATAALCLLSLSFDALTKPLLRTLAAASFFECPLAMTFWPMAAFNVDLSCAAGLLIVFVCFN